MNQSRHLLVVGASNNGAILGSSFPQGPDTGESFVCPLRTIASVAPDVAEHVLLANDNNPPFASGRSPDLPDDKETIRLHLPELLAP